MGALLPISTWIPKDDLLLKKAVEAGASLEALAKGAVPFSRRYTIQEVQNRWHALLYDLDTSQSASAHMVELELSASNLSSQGDPKENGTPKKRKDESVRSHYCAMRKRIRSEPFLPDVDISFLVEPPLHNCTGIEDGCKEQVTINNEHPLGTSMIGDNVVDHFNLRDTDYDMGVHGFPQVSMGDIPAGTDEAAAQIFHSDDRDSLGGEIPGGNGLYEFTGNVPHISVNETIRSNRPQSYEQDGMHENTNAFQEKLAVFSVQQTGTSDVVPCGNPYETANLTGKSYCEFDPVNNPEPTHSGFGQSQGFISPVSDCSATFHQLEYSSPVPTIPIWRTMEDISTPSILNNENLDNIDKAAGEELVCPVDDAKQVNSSRYDVVHSECQLEGIMSDDGLTNSRVISEGDFLELSNSLLNFTNEEVMLLMDVEGKEMIDRGLDGLSSILLNSPNDGHQGDMSIFTEPKPSVAMDACSMTHVVACSGELCVIGGKFQSENMTCDSETSVRSSTLPLDPHPEYQNGVICCTLNSEDPDIPCNDDAYFPTQFPRSFDSSGLQHNTEGDGSSFPLSTVDFSLSRMTNEHGLKPAEEEEILATSRAAGPHFMPEIGSIDPTCNVASELPERVVHDATFRHISIVGGEPSHCGSAQFNPYSISPGELKEDIDQRQPIDYLLEHSIHFSDHTENHPQEMINDFRQEPALPGATQNHIAEEYGCFSETVVNPPLPDQEEQPYEDDKDVPHFSQIEELILKMDLGSFDQDSCISMDVSRYQPEEVKRKILWLEHSSHSYTQSAIASHRAFAIFYGRRLKHYIKKPEVTLGRATDDVSVDIDLAKEGRANKISRRQVSYPVTF
ncbi:Forkhead-associated (FHA) domain [Thalictrum thalictroides]|uniref:Forkhead-associated (FHA) domain n=1 Tax=Thalictrum thalictroides TaxID=46969 RepID=A0A7J6W0M3_THATH|nr:Forkhead-associated (FHA) domain [Thalictrum thalictroides]